MNGERFHRGVLYAAAIYNLIFGAFAVLLPGLYWEWLEMPAPRYAFLWQCIGMVVGCYGVAYFFAARSPRVLWPIVLVGLLGKILGPAGFVFALAEGALPLRFGWILVTNDLIWWVPFFAIVVAGWRYDPYVGPRARLAATRPREG
jgi:hypothetical protein